MAKNEGTHVDDKNGERDGARSDSEKVAADKAAGEKSTPAKPAQSGEKKGRDDEVSRVLRTVYDDTLREDVPDEFQDLLRKLG